MLMLSIWATAKQLPETQALLRQSNICKLYRKSNNNLRVGIIFTTSWAVNGAGEIKKGSYLDNKIDLYSVLPATGKNSRTICLYFLTFTLKAEYTPQKPPPAPTTTTSPSVNDQALTQSPPVLNALQKHDGRKKAAGKGACWLGVYPCEDQNVLLALCYMLAWQQ